MPPPPTLSVLPNPYAALDADGEPAGAYPRADLRGVLVGARLDAKRSTDGALKYLFDTEAPVSLPDLPAHRTALRGGDLLSADEATARAVGLPFVPPAEALAQARQRAADRWRAETGADPAFLSPPTPAPAAR